MMINNLISRLKESISIGNNFWFGNTSTILKGECIGDDSVIGTGAIVTKNIPSNVIAAGNPARVINGGVMWGLQRVPIEGDK